MRFLRAVSLIIMLSCLLPAPASALMLSSTNIPLDSPIYLYLDKLAGFGLIKSDVKGIRPFSKAEAVRLLLEAEQNLNMLQDNAPAFAQDLVERIRRMIPREVSLRKNPENRPQLIDYNPVSSIRSRIVYLNGVPRDFERLVNDPGNDGYFGIGNGLRPACASFPCIAVQRGSEGTPLSENNNGVVYHQGLNAEMRWAAEGYISDVAAALVEPDILYSREGSFSLRLNRAYFKVGGGWLELEVGKDENWLGLGYRGNITLTNNAENFTMVKLSSPEPFSIGLLSWLGDIKFKYALIASRFDRTVTDGKERQPWFYAMKLSAKLSDNLEVGFNNSRQVGGPGVNNSMAATLRGLIGGYGTDNSNGLAGYEVRYRIPWLRNLELYGEVSHEDSFSVQSYVAGFFIPRLTDSGRDDLRFEFFRGNQILYTHGLFVEGYNYKNMPIGESQGGATQDYYAKYSHWFGVRHNVALEYFYTLRGGFGRLPGQAIEAKHSGRMTWNVPVYKDVDARTTYGIERVNNVNLVEGVRRTNQLMMLELRYRY